MSGILERQKSPINFNDTLRTLQDAIFSRLNCHNVGRIIEFDPTTQTCTVELMVLKQFNEQTFAAAPITQVPLVILGGGGGHITMPNPVGTICILLFMDRNIDNFLETGEAYSPSTSRMHDFTDAIALTTFKTLANPLTDYDEKAVTIINEEILKEAQSKSFIKVYGNLVQLHSQTTTEDGTAGATISINDKVSISNSKQNFTSLIGAFLTACENIAVDPNTGILTPASKQAFTDLKEQFEELLG